MKRFNHQLFFIMIVSMLFAVSLFSDVKMNGLFTDNMVLQRDAGTAVFGFADDGEKVNVAFNGQKVSTTAKGGRWILYLEPMKAGGPFEMTITGKNKIVLKNVLVGDVWLCGGQSNMDFPMERFLKQKKILKPKKGREDIEDVIKQYNYMVNNGDNYPNLRLFLVAKNPSEEPVTEIKVEKDFENSWQEGTPSLVKHFSAVGYVFGLKLHQDLKVPVGLIDSNKGGSRAEVWMSKEALKTETSGKYYNGQIYPLIPFTIKGVIWYQGEANSKNAEDCFVYEKTFKKLITSWREEWGQGDFPFLFVQLASFKNKADEPVDELWPLLRESQVRALELKNAGMALAIDLGQEKNIHPYRKIQLSHRLVEAAKYVAYGKNNVLRSNV